MMLFRTVGAILCHPRSGWHMRLRLNSPTTGRVYSADSIQKARQLRRSATPQEVAVWDWPRARRLLGLKLRRQQPVAGFIVDFYCASGRLALELDGAVHDDDSRRTRDAERDSALARLGIRVVRVRNEEAPARRSNAASDRPYCLIDE